jgi:hydrogenase maturation factor HypF (carbamoyltransferase family)
LENIENKLKNDMFKVFSNRQVPVNDGGIALGQMYIAATKREKLCV